MGELTQWLEGLGESDSNLSAKTWEELSGRESETLGKISDFFHQSALNNRWMKESPEQIIEKSAEVIEPLWKQAHFLADVFAEPDEFTVDQIVNFILLNPEIFTNVDYWMLKQEAIKSAFWFNELPNYLKALNPGNMFDLIKCRALESLSALFETEDTISILFERFWRKALEQCLERSPAERNAFKKAFFSFPHTLSPPQLRIDLELLRKIVAQDDLRIFLPYVIEIYIPRHTSEAAISFLYQYDLPALKRLDLADTFVTDVGLYALLRTAPNIEELLGSYKTALAGGENLPNLPKLKKLRLGESNPTSLLSDERLIAFLRKTPNVVKLDVYNCQNVTLAGWENLQGCLPALKNVNLFGTSITSASLFSLFRSAPHIEELDLRECKKITLEGFENFHPLPLLKKVNLSGTRVTDAALFSFLQITPNLVELDLRYCKTPLSGMENLPILHALRKVILAFTSVTDATLIRFLPKIPNLATLDLSHNNLISLAGIENLQSLSTLKKVKLRGTSVIDAHLFALLRRASKIEVLNLGGCSSLTHEGWQDLPDLPSIEAINFSHNMITDAALFTLLPKTPNLKYLSVMGCSNITLTGCQNLPNLTALHQLLLGCTRITDATFLAFMQKVPKTLKEVNIAGCHQITAACKGFLNREFPSLKFE